VLPFSATLRDDVRLAPSDVVVSVTNPSQNATVRLPSFTLQAVAPDQVDVVGTVVIAGVTEDPATIRVEVSGSDPCDNVGTDAREVIVTGAAAPEGVSPGPGGEALPRVTAFHGVRPNPFAGQTTVAFDLARPARVSVEVYSPAGARVRRIAGAAFEAGRHRVAWDGRDDAGRSVPAGVYFIRFESDGVTRSEKALRLP
jgi:hypothetical protein